MVQSHSLNINIKERVRTSNLLTKAQWLKEALAGYLHQVKIPYLSKGFGQTETGIPNSSGVVAPTLAWENAATHGILAGSSQC